MNTKQNLNGAHRIATIDLNDDGKAIIDLHDIVGFVVYFDGGMHPDGSDQKHFPELSTALKYLADVVLELEADGGAWIGEQSWGEQR